MAEISAKIVMELRGRTGAGMMDCKKALAAVEGDMEKAIDYLREKGLAAAAKKQSRIAAEGLAALDGQHRIGNALARLRKLGDLAKAALLQPFKGLQLPFHDGGAHAHAVCAHKQRQALHPHAAPGGQQLRGHIQRPSGGTVRRREGIERIGMGIANQHRRRSFPAGTGVPRLTPSRRSDCWA